MLHRIDTTLGARQVARVRARLDEAGITRRRSRRGQRAARRRTTRVLELRADGCWSFDDPEAAARGRVKRRRERG